MPLTAIVYLDASPVQMGVIGAMHGVPAIMGIFLGVWVDRRSRGPILVMSDVGRIFLLLVVPTAYVFDFLSMELMYVVSFGTGATGMLFEIAYRSFLPSVVRRSELVEANSKLELANSGAVAVGPGIGGLLVELIAAPFALLGSVVMYVISASMFRSIRVSEVISAHAKDSGGNDESILRGIKNGFGFFRRSRALVGTSAAASMLMLFGTSFDTIYILYLVRNLDFTPGMIGLIFSLGSIGLLGATFISSWLTRRIGVGRTLVLGFLILGVGGFIVPAAEGSKAFVFVMMVAAEIAFVLGMVIWNIGHVSLRQAITPHTLMGRVTSIQIVIVRGVVPVGAMIGGYLGEQMGLRGALYVFAGGMAAGVVWLLLLGVWRIQELPELTDADLIEASDPIEAA